MKILRTLTAVFLVFAMLVSFAACAGNGGSEKKDETTTANYIREEKTRIAVPEDSSGLSLAKLAVDRDYAYAVSRHKSTDEIATLIKEGKTDLAIVPVSVAVNLFRETQGGIRILAVNNLVTQYVITKGEEVNELADLKGKTVYSLGKGTASEFIVNEILDKNGIDPEKDITVEYRDTPDEIKAAFEKENGGICILHEPQATEFLVADTKSKRVIRLSEEWKKAEGFDLVQNVVIARKDYIDKNPEYIEKFLGHNELSLNFLNANVDGVSPSFLVNNGYYSDATVAASIIAAGNFVFITGDEMKTSVNGVLDFLSRTDPESVGEIPEGELFHIR